MAVLSATDWQSKIEHIQSGQCWSFNTLDELLGFLRRQAEDPEVLGRRGGSGSVGIETSED